MTTFTDSFSGPNGSPLGTTETGAGTWVALSGVWSRSGGLAACTAAVTTNPLAVVEVGWGDVDLSVGVSGQGGDAAYFRVQDANNWWRVRVREATSTSSYSYWNGGYTLSSTTYVGDVCQESGGPGAIYWATPGFATNPNGGQTQIPEGLDQYAVTSAKCKTDPSATNGTGFWYTAHHNTRYPIWTYSTGTSSTYRYYLTLEKCLNGVITVVKEYSVGTSAATTSIRVVAQGAAISVYPNGGATPVITASDSYLQTATKHGVGKGGASDRTGSAIDSFSVSTFQVPPSKPTFTSPAPGAVLDRTISQQARWTFSDADSGDYQSLADFRYRLVGDTTWTTRSVNGSYTFYDIAAGSLAAGSYEAQVQTYDSLGQPSGWSDSVQFTMAIPPAAPSYVSPTSGGTVPQLATVQWTSSGQDTYQLRRVADDGAGNAADTTVAANVYYDSGEIPDSAATRTRVVEFPVNDRYEHLQLRVRRNGLLSSWVDVRVLVAFTPPPDPQLLAIPDPRSAAIRVAVSNPAPAEGQPAVVGNDIYVDSGAGFERLGVDEVPNVVWVFWAPLSGRDYSFKVVAKGDNGTTSETKFHIFPAADLFPSPSVYPR